MRDPFPPARVAGVTAVGATQQFYPLADVAGKYEYIFFPLSFVVCV